MQLPSRGWGLRAWRPAIAMLTVPAGCTPLDKPGAASFHEAMKSINGATTYTNYGDSTKPQPDFVLPKGTATSVFQTIRTVTIDGLKFQGSHNTSGGGASFDSGAGICVCRQGAGSTIENSEVTDCDFGVMLQGNGSLATNNFVHDVNGQALDGTTDLNPNSVGGGKGIYARASDVEVSYNTIVNGNTSPSWTGADGSNNGGCGGGATEVATVVQHKGAGATVDQGMLMEMWNGPSSGKSGGVTPANQISLTNNLRVHEGVNDFYDFNPNWTGADMPVNAPIVVKSKIFLNDSTSILASLELETVRSSPAPKTLTSHRHNSLWRRQPRCLSGNSDCRHDP